jgi:hypothetical protein
MLKKTITYTGFDGEEITETLHFHYTKAELAEMELSTDGGLKERMENIVRSGIPREIIDSFRKFIVGGYGERSADGKRFIKTPEMQAAFGSSEAYSSIFMSIITDADEAANFIKAMLPRELASVFDDGASQSGDAPAEIEDKRPLYQRENRPATTDEVRTMTREQLVEAMAFANGVRKDSPSQ